VAAAAQWQATLTADEQDGILAARLDGYINFAYRALKADRDGRDRELANADWSAQRLLPLLDGALNGDPAALRELYRGVERRCLLMDSDRGTNALTSTIDSWGAGLTLLRGDDMNGQGP